MLIYLGNMEDKSTRNSQETLKVISKKLAKVFKPKEDKIHK